MQCEIHPQGGVPNTGVQPPSTPRSLPSQFMCHLRLFLVTKNHNVSACSVLQLTYKLPGHGAGQMCQLPLSPLALPS